MTFSLEPGVCSFSQALPFYHQAGLPQDNQYIKAKIFIKAKITKTHSTTFELQPLIYADSNESLCLTPLNPFPSCSLVALIFHHKFPGLQSSISELIHFFFSDKDKDLFKTVALFGHALVPVFNI